MHRHPLHRPAPVLPGDGHRVNFLRSLNILDTPQDIAFDQITEAASTITHSPIALVSLVDSDRQWFKSKVGLDVSETSRDLAFCSHVISQNDDTIFVVRDAREDERFKYSDLVLGGPLIRFYAGVPLIITGDDGCKYKIGTLCIIDGIPRVLEDHHFPVMKTLAELVVDQIDRLAGRHDEMAHASACYMTNPDIHVPYQYLDYAPSERVRHSDCELPTLADTEAMWQAFLSGRRTASPPPPQRPTPPAPARKPSPRSPLPASSASSSSSSSSRGSSPRSSFSSDADEGLWRSSSDAEEDGDALSWTDPALAGRAADHPGCRAGSG